MLDELLDIALPISYSERHDNEFQVKLARILFQSYRTPILLHKCFGNVLRFENEDCHVDTITGHVNF